MEDYLFSFEFEGRVHCLTITAQSEEDARRKVKAAAEGMNYDGVLTYASDPVVDLQEFDPSGLVN